MRAARVRRQFPATESCQQVWGDPDPLAALATLSWTGQPTSCTEHSGPLRRTYISLLLAAGCDPAYVWPSERVCGARAMGRCPRERPANAASAAEGERRDSNPRPPGPQPGTRLGPLPLVFRSTPLQMRPSGGSCPEARLRRSRSIPSDPLCFAPNLGSWAQDPRERAVLRTWSHQAAASYRRRPGPGELNRSRFAWERKSPPRRCALSGMDEHVLSSTAHSPLAHPWKAISSADVGQPARRCRKLRGRSSRRA
jgi:hypothetical protein